MKIQVHLLKFNTTELHEFKLNTSGMLDITADLRIELEGAVVGAAGTPPCRWWLEQQQKEKRWTAVVG